MSTRSRQLVRSCLSESLLFKDLSGADMDMVLAAMRRVEVGTGEVVVRQGEACGLCVRSMLQGVCDAGLPLLCSCHALPP